MGAKKALAGGVLAALITFAGQWIVGNAFDAYEARQLIEAGSSAALYFGNSVVSGSATVLALMLTMISLSIQTENSFGPVFYKRIQRIGFLSTIALITGIIFLTFLSVPIQESDQIPPFWFKVIYGILIAFVALLSGLMVSIVLMLLNAMNGLINFMKPDMDEEVDKKKQKEEPCNQEQERAQEANDASPEHVDTREREEVTA